MNQRGSGFVAPWLVLAMCALLLAALPRHARAGSAHGVGFQSIRVPDPVNGGKFPGYVFYPAAASTAATKVGPYVLHAKRDATAMPGRKPLIVISHGHGGSALGHHDLAVVLARHGFVVATIEHPKDNYHDTSGNGTAAVLIGRPIEVKATISMLLADPHWKVLVDPDKIGVAGFSAGGYTALMLVGGVPSFSRFISFCRAHPRNRNVCQPYAKLKAEFARKGVTVAHYMQKLQSELHRWGDTDDPRIKAAFAMSPFSMVFDRAGLASINRPVYIYDGADDHFQPLRYNSLHAAAMIKTLVGVKLIPNAGHFVFLAPCPPPLAKAAAHICTDPPGVNRASAHRQINADALAFFRGTLHVVPAPDARGSMPPRQSRQGTIPATSASVADRSQH